MGEPIEDGGQQDEAEEMGGELVVASANVTDALEAPEAIFDFVALPVAAAKKGHRVAPCAPGWDSGAGALAAQPRAERIGIERRVAHRSVAAQARHERRHRVQVVALAGGEHDRTMRPRSSVTAASLVLRPRRVRRWSARPRARAGCLLS